MALGVIVEWLVAIPRNKMRKNEGNIMISGSGRQQRRAHSWPNEFVKSGNLLSQVEGPLFPPKKTESLNISKKLLLSVIKSK